MKKPRILFAIVLTFVVFSSINVANAEDYQVEFLLRGTDQDVTYDFEIVFPENLYEYYTDKSHMVTAVNEFSGFVTPHVFEPVANRIWEINNNDEDFANSVLMIVHQMDYEETTPIKYPVETMIDGKGDCDLFSIIAASIMKAGGLDVVLLYYEEQTHMNIGIALSSPPQDARDSAYHLSYDKSQYYIAECTGENWIDGWRVGECPPELKDVSTEVISLEGSEQLAPGQTSASFTSLESSILSLDITPVVSFQNTDLNLRGQLYPTIENQNITFYASVNSSPWTVIGLVSTKPNGYFHYLLKNEFSGIISIRASWSGDNQYAGSVSATKNVTTIPLIVVELAIFGILLGVAGVILIVITKRSRNEENQIEYW